MKDEHDDRLPQPRAAHGYKFNEMARCWLFGGGFVVR